MAKKITEDISYPALILKRLISNVVGIGAALALFFFGYQYGTSSQEVKMNKEIIDLSQKHNTEVMDLKTTINLLQINIKIKENNEQNKNKR